jgi:hypothetical protein
MVNDKGNGQFWNGNGYVKKKGVINSRRTVLYDVLHHCQENIKLKYTYRKEGWRDLSIKCYIRYFLLP